MKFKSYVGKALFVGSKILTFKDEVYETADKDEIAALEKAKDVTKLQAAKKSEAE